MDFSPINDFYENIKNKVSNPFFGTLILVVLYRNWEVVYSIFNFDKYYTLQEKIDYITSCYSEKIFINETIFNIVVTLAIVIIGYIIVILFKLLDIFVDHNILPVLSKKISSKSTVDKIVYDRISDLNIKLNENFDTVRTDNTRLSSENKKLTEDLIKYERELNSTAYSNKSLLKENQDFRKERTLNESEIQKLGKSIIDLKVLYDNLENYKNETEIEFKQYRKIVDLDESDFWHNLNSLPLVIDNTILDLQANDEYDKFINFCREYYIENRLELNEENTTKFKTEDIFISYLRNDKKEYKISIIGYMIYKLFDKNSSY